MVPKRTNFTVWVARAGSGREWYQNESIPPSGQQGPDLVENGTKINQFRRLGGQGPARDGFSNILVPYWALLK